MFPIETPMPPWCLWVLYMFNAVTNLTAKKESFVWQISRTHWKNQKSGDGDRRKWVVWFFWSPGLMGGALLSNCFSARVPWALSVVTRNQSTWIYIKEDELCHESIVVGTSTTRRMCTIDIWTEKGYKTTKLGSHSVSEEFGTLITAWASGTII